MEAKRILTLDELHSTIINAAARIESEVLGSDFLKKNIYSAEILSIIQSLQSNIGKTKLLPKLKILLAGKTKSGKSTCGNEIIGRRVFLEKETAETASFWTVESFEKCQLLYCKQDSILEKKEFPSVREIEKAVSQLDRPENDIVVHMPCTLDSNLAVIDSPGISEKSFFERCIHFCNNEASCLIYVISLNFGGVMKEDIDFLKRRESFIMRNTIFVLTHFDEVYEKAKASVERDYEEEGTSEQEIIHIAMNRANAVVDKFKKSIEDLQSAAPIFVLGSLHLLPTKRPESAMKQLASLKEAITENFGKSYRAIELERLRDLLIQQLRLLIINYEESTKVKLTQEQESARQTFHRELDLLNKLRLETHTWADDIPAILNFYMYSQLQEELLRFFKSNVVKYHGTFLNKGNYIEYILQKFKAETIRLFMNEIDKSAQKRFKEISISHQSTKATVISPDQKDPIDSSLIETFQGWFGLTFGLGSVVASMEGGIAVGAIAGGIGMTIGGLIGAGIGGVIVVAHKIITNQPFWTYEGAAEQACQHLVELLKGDCVQLIGNNIRGEVKNRILEFVHGKEAKLTQEYSEKLKSNITSPNIKAAFQISKDLEVSIRA